MALTTKEKTFTFQIPDTFTPEQEQSLIFNVQYHIENLIASDGQKLTTEQNNKWKTDVDNFLIANGLQSKYFDANGTPKEKSI